MLVRSDDATPDSENALRESSWQVRRLTLIAAAHAERNFENERVQCLRGEAYNDHPQTGAATTYDSKQK